VGVLAPARKKTREVAQTGARRSWSRRLVAAIGALLMLTGVLGAGPAQGQVPIDTIRDRSNPDATEVLDAQRSLADTSSGPIVRRIRFEGTTPFSAEALRARVRTSPNRRILGVPGLTWWRWIYRVGESGALGKRLSEALKEGGERPAFLDSTRIARDVNRLKVFHQQQGFREAEVSARVVPTNRPDRVEVEFRIAAGPPTHIRQVEYRGLDRLAPRHKIALARRSVLQPRRVAPEAPLRFQARDQRYVRSQLLEERDRLLTFLRDIGYAAVSRDSIQAVVYQPAPDSFDVTFRVRTGPRFRFGDVHFSVTGPEEGDRLVRDTVEMRTGRAAPTERRQPLVTTEIRRESKLDAALLRRSLQFDPGALYRRSAVQATKQRLEGAGVFSFTNITPQFGDTTRLEPGGEPYLPHQITLRTRRRHRLRAETFLLQRSGEDALVAGAGSELGIGASATYENANLLGGGEAFQLRASGSIAASLDSIAFPSRQVEVSTSLTYPYLVAPMQWLDAAAGFADTRTRLTLSFLTARRDRIGLIIQGRGGAQMRLEMEHNDVTTSLLDIFETNISSPDTLAGFRNSFLDRVIGQGDRTGIDPVQRAQILEDYTVPQINSVQRYTLRSINVDPLRRRQGYSYELSAEVGNYTLPYLLDRFAFTPGTIENSLPGLALFGADEDNRLIYRPYVRAVADLRRYWRLGGGNTLATKAIGGIAHPTGRPRVVPFDRRFYSGGATSVRGWRLRSLGPAGVLGQTQAELQQASADRAPAGRFGAQPFLLGGDIKLEFSAELRTTLLRDVLGADWMSAAFVDAGNVWFGPRNPGTSRGRFRVPDFLGQFGVGTGVGLRLSWEYFIARLDLAYRAYDPSPFNRGLLEAGPPGGTLPPLLHFGIGHTF
jgi:outer membrane protein assembly factor BamA